MHWIFSPSYWFMMNKYSKEWDRFVRDAIDGDDIEFDGLYRAKANGVEIWIGNYPYSYGSPYDGPGVRPSRGTIKKLFNHHVKKFIAMNVKNDRP